MSKKQQTQEDVEQKAFEEEVQKTLTDAKIIARWAKKPFYIS